MRRNQEKPAERRRLPSVRLAPRDELASMARVAPLLRAARDLGHWTRQRYGQAAAAGSQLDASSVAAAASALDMAPREVRAAWGVMAAAARLAGREAREDGLAAVLAHGETEAILRIWDAALAVVLDSEELDGIATALYTVGGPVGMDGLFDAYASAAGPRRGPSSPLAQSARVPAAPVPAAPVPASAFRFLRFRFLRFRFLRLRSSLLRRQALAAVLRRPPARRARPAAWPAPIRARRSRSRLRHSPTWASSNLAPKRATAA